MKEERDEGSNLSVQRFIEFSKLNKGTMANIMQEHHYFLSVFSGNELELYFSSYFTKGSAHEKLHVTEMRYIVMEMCDLI